MKRHFLLLFTATAVQFSALGQNTFPSTGNVGIGTTSPLKPLHVNGFGAFGNRVTSANATRALNLADDNAVMRILRVHSSFAPAVELISRTSADGPNVAYWDMYAEPTDKSFRIRDRVRGGSGLDRVIVSNAGNVGIGTTAPHASAILDLTSTSKGMLTPRMTQAQRDAIPSPAQGLVIYQIDNSRGFYYYESGWQPIIPPTPPLANASLSNLTSPTAVNQHLLPNTTGARDLGSAARTWRNIYLESQLFINGRLFLHNKGASNTFVGDLAGGAINSGSFNTAMGSNSLLNNNSGFNNTAVGYGSLKNNTSGWHNTATGFEALQANIEGEGNTAMGDQALTSNQYGNYNTAVGWLSMRDDQFGRGNTAVGSFALIKGGNNNTALGYLAGTYNAGNLTNATAIGFNTEVDASNKVRIGSTSVTSIGGQVNWTAFSDGRYKQNVHENIPGLVFINALRPITYTVDVQGLNAYYTKDRKEPDDENRRAAKEKLQTFMKNSEKKASNAVYSGFVAQEVEKAAKKLNYEFSGVDKQSEGGLYGLRYSDFVAPLVKAVQELSKENEELKKSDEETKKKNEQLEARLQKLEALFINNNTNSTSVNVSSAYLEQNAPNPSRGMTTIRYGIPDGATSARLTLTNNKGQVLKTINITGRGTAQVNLDTSTLSAGVYTYALWIGEKKVDTKQLVITR